jgi:hypothetical protein
MIRRCHGLQSTYDHPTIYRKFSSQVSQYLNSIQTTTGVQQPISQTAQSWRRPLCVSTPQPELSWITDTLLWLTWCTGTIWPWNPSRNCQPLRNGWWQLRIMGPRDSKQTISLQVLKSLSNCRKQRFSEFEVEEWSERWISWMVHVAFSNLYF